MTVEPLVSDLPIPSASLQPSGDSSAFARALDTVGSTLDRAERSEDAFAAGSGDLQTAMYDRARADVMLSVASAAAQRAAQALNTLTNMQV